MILTDTISEITLDVLQTFETYKQSASREPLFLNGDSVNVLQKLPDSSIDCVITSPPYWGLRQYENGGIGLEESADDFVNNLLDIIAEVKRVLKPEGSFWLNIGDTYKNKCLQAIPWRVAIAMIDRQKWILRNSVVWNKHKGGLDSSKDKLRNVHEDFFHFVKNSKYYYNSNNIRVDARKAIVKNGSVVSATGVSGVRYKRQIELSTSLSNTEKANAFKDLALVLDRIKKGEISDFRMIIR